MVPWTSVILLLCAALGLASSRAPYYGKRLGSFRTLEHEVSGDIYAVDSKTIYIRDFNYDGQAPDAYFYAGSGTKPSNLGYKIPDENGGLKPLGAYKHQHLTLTLPNGVTLDSIQWFSVWCKEYTVDFGNLILPSPVTDYPRPQRIGPFVTSEHDVSSGDVVVVDSQTLLIPDFTYSGQGPDAHFWAGKGYKPSRNGFLVPNENGNDAVLTKYDSKTIVLTLPGERTVFDIDYISVWCKSFDADFGHLKLHQRNLNVPPSLKTLGVRPQSKLNCEVLDDELSFEVRWAVAGESVVMQLVSKVEDGQYMAFGISGNSERSRMVDGDAIVTWMNRQTGQGYARDYNLQAKVECSDGNGVCTDDESKDGKNSVRLLNSAFINGFSMLTFQRPLSPLDPIDKAISTNSSQAVIWASGPLSLDGGIRQHTRRVEGDLLVEFGRQPAWNCPVTSGANSATSSPAPATEPLPPPAPSSSPVVVQPWHIPAIPCDEPEDHVFYAQIGPTGGDRGFSALTGRAGWGLAWYINGLLIPEIDVVRGQTYTFVVEGGLNPNRPAKYHPFYITDDPEGGYQFKTDEERAGVRVFAGVGLGSSGLPEPTSTGRLCEWMEDPERPSESVGSFGAYQRTLQLECEEGQPGILQWTPDESTPDTVFYQCFTHRYLGWRINVVDSCNAKSRPNPVGLNDVNRMIEVDYDDYLYYDDNVAQASVQVEQEVNAVAPPDSKQPGAQADTAPPSYDDYYPLEVAQRGKADNDENKPGFDFEYFPPGFPRPDLDVTSDGLPIPRPDFQFGAKIREDSQLELKPGERMNVAVVPHGVTVPPELGPGFYGPPPEDIDTSQYQLLAPENGSKSDANSTPVRFSAAPPVRRRPTPPRPVYNQHDEQSSRAPFRSRRPVPTPIRGSSGSEGGGTRLQPPPPANRRQHESQEVRLEGSIGFRNGDQVRDHVPGVVFGRPQADSRFTPSTVIRPPVKSPHPGHGFNPQQIVFETGFTPVQQSDRNNPPLAFEVNEADSNRHNLKLNKLPSTLGVNGPSDPVRINPGPFRNPESRPQAVNVPLPVSLVPAAPSSGVNNAAVNAIDRVDRPVETVVQLGPIPPPPHLTEGILADALVFSPDQLPTRYRPVSNDHPPFRQQQQHRPPTPPRRSGGFLEGLLSYIPGLAPSRPVRRRPLQPFGHQNPNRVLNMVRDRAHVRVPSAHPQKVVVPVPMSFNEAGGPSAQLRRTRQPPGETTRRHVLPSAPHMQPVFERNVFRPPPVDGSSFHPLRDVPPTRPPVHRLPVAPSLQSIHEPYQKLQKRTGESATETIENTENPTTQHILEDVWQRMREKQQAVQG